MLEDNLLDYEEFASEAFVHEPKLRYVGIVDGSFHNLLSRMRGGVQSVTTDEEERNFVQIMPPIIVEAVDKMQPLLGKLDTVTVRYEKVLVFFRVSELAVVMSFEPNVTTPFISSLSEFMKTLSSKHLT